MDDNSLFGQGPNNFAPETKMLIRGGSQASPPVYLLDSQTSQAHVPRQPHPGREDQRSGRAP